MKRLFSVYINVKKEPIPSWRLHPTPWLYDMNKHESTLAENEYIQVSIWSNCFKRNIFKDFSFLILTNKPDPYPKVHILNKFESTLSGFALTQDF